MGYPLSRACKDIGTYFLNQFPQYKVKRLTPEVYALYTFNNKNVDFSGESHTYS